MNESVIHRPADVPGLGTKKKSNLAGRGFAATAGYSLLTVVLLAGWYLRQARLVNPEHGVGYWLGIGGATMMLVLLLYPCRKRLTFLRIFGPIRDWFRLHMLFGLLGPLLILYHCNFQVGSFNSKVALYCMLLVAGSGIIGRHFYARLHRGLYGRKANLKELQCDLESSLEAGHFLGALTPDLVSRLQELSKDVQGSDLALKTGRSGSLKWALQRYFLQWSLIMGALRELKTRAAHSDVVAQNYKRFRSLIIKHISTHMDALSRVSQFAFYERLFSLWHVLHLPIFFVMILTAVIHVFAVHMY